MAASNDCPPQIKPWYNYMQGFMYKHDFGTVFADWVTLFRYWITLPYPEAAAQQVLARYDTTERKAFSAMYQEFYKAFETEVKADDTAWFDFFGVAYEYTASRGKCSSMGQFFTPPEVCSMIAALQLIPKPAGPVSFSDPACGSGRLLLAANAYAQGPNFYSGADLDRVCVEMAAVNMAMHGMKGEVIHGDTLRMEYFARYSINPHQRLYNGLPHIYEVHKDYTGHISAWEALNNRSPDTMPEVPKIEQEANAEPVVQKITITYKPGQQLPLF